MSRTSGKGLGELNVRDNFKLPASTHRSGVRSRRLVKRGFIYSLSEVAQQGTNEEARKGSVLRADLILPEVKLILMVSAPHFMGHAP